MSDPVAPVEGSVSADLLDNVKAVIAASRDRAERLARREQGICAFERATGTPATLAQLNDAVVRPAVAVATLITHGYNAHDMATITSLNKESIELTGRRLTWAGVRPWYRRAGEVHRAEANAPDYDNDLHDESQYTHQAEQADYQDAVPVHHEGMPLGALVRGYRSALEVDDDGQVEQAESAGERLRDALEAQCESVLNGTVWPPYLWMGGLVSETGLPFQRLHNGLGWHTSIAHIDVLGPIMLDESLRTPDHYFALTFMLSQDLINAYMGPPFRPPADSYRIVAGEQHEHAGDADELMRTVRAMQDTLDEFGIDREEGMSTWAHKQVYDRLMAIASTAKTSADRNTGHDAMYNTITSMITQDPSVLRTNPQLHKYIHPEVLHVCANRYAGMELRRRNAMFQQGMPPTTRMPRILRVGEAFMSNSTKDWITLGEDNLKTMADIASAIDAFKSVWAEFAMHLILPAYSHLLNGASVGPSDSDVPDPCDSLFMQENLGVIRRTIAAFTQMGPWWTARLMEVLDFKGYREPHMLFYHDWRPLKKALTDRIETEHAPTDASTVGAGPSLAQIVAFQPGFLTWVLRPRNDDSLPMLFGGFQRFFHDQYLELLSTEERAKIAAKVMMTIDVAKSSLKSVCIQANAFIEPEPNIKYNLDWYFGKFPGLKELMTGRTRPTSATRRSARVNDKVMKARREGRRATPYQDRMAPPRRE